MRDPRRPRDGRRRSLDDAIGVIRFGWTMFRKLRANRHKAHWMEAGDFEHFVFRLHEEIREMENARDRLDGRAVMLEAADVGNFAMMIHERVRVVGDF